MRSFRVMEECYHESYESLRGLDSEFPICMMKIGVSHFIFRNLIFDENQFNGDLSTATGTVRRFSLQVVLMNDV